MSDDRKGIMGGSFTFGGKPAGEEGSVAIPFRLLLLADFGGITARQRPERVDKDNLADTLAKAGVTLTLRVPNLLGNASGPLDAALIIAGFKDFAPARLAGQIPLIASALALREKLIAFAAGKLPASGLQAALAGATGLERVAAAIAPALSRQEPPRAAAPAAPPAATPPPPSDGDDLDRLLNMVDVPAAKPDSASAPSPLIAAVLGETRGYRTVPGAAAPLAQVEALIAAQIEAVLADPHLAAIEAAWLGLRFVIRRADFREPILVERLDVARGEADDKLHSAVVSAEAAGANPPLAAIAAAYDYALTAADIGKLHRLAEAGEEMMVPVVAGLGPDILGLDDAAAIARLQDPASRIEAVGGDSWNALREKSCARWLAAVANPFVLRAAATTEELGFTALRAPLGRPCWGNPAWAVTSLMLGSAARLGWPTEIVGRDAGAIENLDLVSHDIAGTAVQLSVALPLSPDAASGLADAGIACLVGERERDSAWLVRASSVYRQGRLPNDDDGRLARLFGSLPYQLMAAQVGRAMSAAKPGLAGRDPQEAAAGLQAMLRRLFESTGPGASAKVTAGSDPDEPTRVLLDVAARTGRYVLNGAPLYLDLPL